MSEALRRLLDDLREKGPGYVLSSRAAGLRQRLYVLWLRLSRGRRTFEVGGRSYRYFFHGYRETWRTERTVEVPWALAAVRAHGGADVLEVGNVLSHYARFPHEVVDKYEAGPGVLNQDVVDFAPGKRYGLIVTISTLEHVGWDESPRDPQKVRRAVERLKGLLAPGGALLITLPLGWHSEVDRWLFESPSDFGELRFLKRVSAENEWREVPGAEAQGTRYGEPFEYANAVALVAIRRP
ncbi:MAG: hypothetical protein HY554_11305 [Elusimicrobia bacterium]|nr:hypothetical protein [Elusimicrobiota bacterium]